MQGAKKLVQRSPSLTAFRAVAGVFALKPERGLSRPHSGPHYRVNIGTRKSRTTAHPIELLDSLLAAKLRALVVKRNLSLGRLPAADRDLALA